MDKKYISFPYLTNMEAKITKKLSKDNKSHVCLSDTLFSPTSVYGIPCDKGTINGINVIDVYSLNNQIYHVLEKEITDTKVKISIDFKNRYDYMQQLAAFDLIKYFLHKVFATNIIALNFDENHSSIDISLNSLLINEWTSKIENLCNEFIQKSFDIKKTIIKDKENNLIEYSVDNMTLASHEHPYIDNIGELFAMHILKTVKLDNAIRIYFIAGYRAFDFFKKQSAEIASFSEQYDLNNTDVFQKFKYMGKQIESYKETIKSLNDTILKKEEEILELSRKFVRGVSITSRYYEDSSISLSTLADLVQSDFIILGNSAKNVYIKNNHHRFNINNIIKQMEKEYHVTLASNTGIYQGKLLSKDSKTFVEHLTQNILKSLR